MPRSLRSTTGGSRLQPKPKMQPQTKTHAHAHTRTSAHRYARTFEILPVEIRQLIADCFEEDKDVASYRLICKSTNYSIDEDEGSFWRTQFLNSYDPPESVPEGDRSTVNEWFKRQYQSRKRAEGQKFVFDSGNSEEEANCLVLFKDLLIGACERMDIPTMLLIFQPDTFNTSVCKAKKQSVHSPNMDRIERIAKAKGLLDCVLRRPTTRANKSPTNPVLLAIQLILTHLSLTAPLSSKMAKVWGFPDTQAVVYLPNSSRPIFKGPTCQEIDIDWTLHVASFFRNYLLSKQEPTHIHYENLDRSERPQGWTKPLSTSPLKLGKHWKGTYAYVDHDEIAQIRSGFHEDYPVQDHMCGEDTAETFQDLRLGFPKGQLEFWPDIFEHILKSRAKIEYRTPTTRAQKRATGPDALPEGEPVSFCFKGGGEDASEKFQASGWFNPLPPQHGIPGWHRMTMMKYYIDESSGQPDLDSLWAYEGVVLPGGMVMLGRWWSPTFDDGPEYSGPFIFWNVDASMPAIADDTQTTE
ncbi:hypothetical protein D6C79_04507 [Aureobasidium pullulans]|nr:hypothetical protein D6C79_04507 [Aureobasidium pullulans]